MKRLLNTMRRDEEGVTIVTAMFVSAILLLLITLMFTQIIHTGQATSADRYRSTAFNVAEAGIDDAVSQLALDSTYAGNAVPKPVLGQGSTLGTFTTTVTIPAGVPNDRTILSVGTSKTASGVTTTHVRSVMQSVTLEPLAGFNYALFSSSTIAFNQNLSVTGNTYSTSPTVTQNLSTVTGNLVSPSSITTNNNTTINGDVWSGGNVTVSTGTTVTGNVLATGSVTLQNNAKVVGDVRAASITNNGTIQGQQVIAAQPAPATRTLPTFSYNPANYPAPIGPPVAMSSTGMTTCWGTGVGCPAGVSRTSMHGVYYITDGGTITGPNQRTTLDGDFYLITNGRVSMSRDFNTATSAPYKLVVISTSTSISPAAITWSNNITMPANISALLYSLGGVAFTNQKSFHGLVYAGQITTDQNMTVVYEPSLKTSVPGFEWNLSSAAAYDIHPGLWRACEGPAC